MSEETIKELEALDQRLGLRTYKMRILRTVLQSAIVEVESYKQPDELEVDEDEKWAAADRADWADDDTEDLEWELFE